MFEVGGDYKPHIFFVPVLIFLVVVVGGLIVFILLNHYLYELRRKRLVEERVYVEDVARRLEEIKDPVEVQRLLKEALKGLRRPNRIALIDLINSMAEPSKRSLYLEQAFADWGKESLSRQALSARRKWKRIEAIDLLGLFDQKEAIRTLVQCLEDKDEDAVYAAVQALATKKDLEAAEALLDLLGTGRVSDKRLVAILEHFPVPIHTLLWPKLKDPRPEMRAWAATLLEVSEEDETVTRLIEAARDPDADVRSAAIRSLGVIGNPWAKEALPDAFNDEAWFVRAGAARTAGALEATEFFEQVVGLLWDRNWWVRQNAKLALITFCPRVEKKLVRYLTADDRFARNMVAEVLETCGAVERRAAELEKNPDSEEARRFFESLLVAEGRGAIEGLARRATPELRRTLRALLDRPETSLRKGLKGKP